MSSTIAEPVIVTRIATDPATVAAGNILLFSMIGRVNRVAHEDGERALYLDGLNGAPPVFRAVTNEVIRKLMQQDGRAAVFTVDFDKVDGTRTQRRCLYLGLDAERAYSHVLDLDKPIDPSRPAEQPRISVNHRGLHSITVDGIKWVSRT
jgi:hypothetical protein